MIAKVSNSFVSLCLLVAFSARAQMVEVQDSGQSGKAKAEKYFQKRKPSDTTERAPSSDSAPGPKPHFFALHIGTYVDSQGYNWGNGDQHNIGKFNAGVTYRLGEWVNSADFMIRMEYSSYSLDEGDARKLAFLAMIGFPDSNSRFPLYIAAGVGPGFYLKQLHGQSAVSFDYQLVGGARFMNVIDNLGFFVEFGLKNDIQLFSEGQFNGLFLGAGTAWSF